MRVPHYAQVYKARDGWRWRLVAGNGKIVADSGEAYASKRNAKRAFVATVVASWSARFRSYAIGFAATLLERGEGK